MVSIQSCCCHRVAKKPYGKRLRAASREPDGGHRLIMWRRIRIALLSLVLAFVAIDQWLSQYRAADWSQPLHVVVYPIDGDGLAATKTYIAQLERQDFVAVEDFFAREGGRYGLANHQPVVIDLAPEIDERPPEIPDGRSTLGIMLWSLRLRYWAWRVDDYVGPAADVRLFVSYFDPESTPRLDHSTGLRKGMIGVIKAFAASRLGARNQVVIAHELMHTLGATDHYDLVDNQPRYPDGFADPEQIPLYPQHRAEIMAGRIPIAADKAVMPASLAVTVVGRKTAEEIHWLD